MPLLVSGLPDFSRAGAEGEQTFQFGVLVPVDGIDVNVQGKSSSPRVAAGTQDDGGLQAAEPDVRRADLDRAIFPVELDVTEDVAPKPRQHFGIGTVEDQFADTA